MVFRDDEANSGPRSLASPSGVVSYQTLPSQLRLVSATFGGFCTWAYEIGYSHVFAPQSRAQQSPRGLIAFRLAQRLPLITVARSEGCTRMPWILIRWRSSVFRCSEPFRRCLMDSVCADTGGTATVIEEYSPFCVPSMGYKAPRC